MGTPQQTFFPIGEEQLEPRMTPNVPTPRRVILVPHLLEVPMV